MSLMLSLLIMATAWLQAGPDHVWEFPRDHHAHAEYRYEWWYVTGQLDEPPLGFQVTLFRLGLTPDRPDWNSDWATGDLVLGQVAVTDIQSGEHLFSEVLTRTGPGRGGFPTAPDSVLAWCRAPAGTAGRWSVRHAEDGSFSVTANDLGQGLLVDLHLVPTRPMVFQGPNGYSQKDSVSGAGSLYYSFTRMAASGLVAAGADTFSTQGRAWLDREIFTSQLADQHGGWDWLSLQLDDGRDLMLFVLRDLDGQPGTARATLVSAAGEPRWLEAPLDVLIPRRWWTSPVSGARYPVAWQVSLPAAGLDLELSALVDDQENVGLRSGVTYWEGAVECAEGRGYVEMTGYTRQGAEAGSFRSLRKMPD